MSRSGLSPPLASDVLTLAGVAAVAIAAPLADLHKRNFADGWTAQAIAAILGLPGTAVLVCRAGEVLAGFVLIRTAADESEVLTIAVDEPWRHRGIGRHLLLTAAGWAREAGARSLFIEVAEDNAAARSLYRTTGFIPVGRRRGYYRRCRGAATDALILSLALSSGAADRS
jgi:ribosomal-protein-alanine N-acetyltransferase